MRIFITILLLGTYPLILFSANQLERTRMEVSLEKPSERVAVRVICQVRLDSVVDQIPVRLISQEGIGIQNVKAIILGEEYPLELVPINPKVAEGVIIGRFLKNTDKLLEIVLTYELPGVVFKKNSARVTLPLVFIDWKPEAASAEAFTALVEVPEGYAVQSIFPAMQWTKEMKDKDIQYSFNLQTIPAWVKFNIYQGAIPFFSLELMVDLGVILVLVILLFVGWKKFRYG